MSPAWEHGRTGGPKVQDPGILEGHTLQTEGVLGSLYPRLGLVSDLRHVAGPGGLGPKRS